MKSGSHWSVDGNVVTSRGSQNWAPSNLWGGDCLHSLCAVWTVVVEPAICGLQEWLHRPIVIDTHIPCSALWYNYFPELK
jgi:hypothetical protein